MSDSHQFEIIKKLQKYFSLQPSESKEVSQYLKLMAGEISDPKYDKFVGGLCFGLSVCHGAMDLHDNDLENHLEWWENAIHAVIEWDGTPESLSKPVTFKQRNPSDLNTIFQRVANYVFANHAYEGKISGTDWKGEAIKKDLAIYHEFMREGSAQRKFLKPEEKNFELVDDKGKLRTIQSYQEITLDFNPARAAKKIDKINIDNQICITTNSNHATRLGFRNNQYIVYDPNYPAGKPLYKTFNSKKEALAELQVLLTTLMGIRIEDSFKLRIGSIYPAKQYEANAIQGTQLHEIARVAPDQLRNMIREANLNTVKGQQFIENIMDALTTRNTDSEGGGCLMACCAIEALGTLIQKIDGSDIGAKLKAKIVEAIAMDERDGWTMMHELCHYPKILGELLDTLSENTKENQQLREKIAAAAVVPDQRGKTPLALLVLESPNTTLKLIESAQDTPVGKKLQEKMVNTFEMKLMDKSEVLPSLSADNFQSYLTKNKSDFEFDFRRIDKLHKTLDSFADDKKAPFLIAVLSVFDSKITNHVMNSSTLKRLLEENQQAASDYFDMVTAKNQLLEYRKLLIDAGQMTTKEIDSLVAHFDNYIQTCHKNLGFSTLSQDDRNRLERLEANILQASHKTTEKRLGTTGIITEFFSELSPEHVSTDDPMKSKMLLSFLVAKLNDLNFQKQVILSDVEINQLMPKLQEEKPELTPVERNRIFMQAIIQKPENWSPVFANCFSSCVDAYRQFFSTDFVELFSELRRYHEIIAEYPDRHPPDSPYILIDRIKKCDEWFAASMIVDADLRLQLYNMNKQLIDSVLIEAINDDATKYHSKGDEVILTQVLNSLPKNVREPFVRQLANQLNTDSSDPLKYLCQFLDKSYSSLAISPLGDKISQILPSIEEFVSFIENSLPRENQAAFLFAMGPQLLKYIHNADDLIQVLSAMHPDQQTQFWMKLEEGLRVRIINNAEQMNRVLIHFPEEQRENIKSVFPSIAINTPLPPLTPPKGICSGLFRTPKPNANSVEAFNSANNKALNNQERYFILRDYVADSSNAKEHFYKGLMSKFPQLKVISIENQASVGKKFGIKS